MMGQGAGRGTGLGFRLVCGAGVAAVIAAACSGSPSKPSNGGNNGGGGGGVTNAAPVVKSIAVSDTRVEVGTPITLTATVEDAETPVASLSYAWTIPGGTVSGTGAAVSWTPGEDLVTPGDFTLKLTVTETYTSAGTQKQNTASGEVSVHVNNSPKELRELSLRFLGDFANSKVSPEKCVSEFSNSCNGKKDELADIDDTRHDYEHIGSTLRHTSLSINADRVRATVHTFCSFTVKVITTQPRDEPCQNGKCPLGSVGSSTGDCWTNNVYENGRWWLCDSHFTPQRSLLASPGTFTPTFFRRSRD